jgi:uncharacterized protein (TIGR04141 family)
LESILDDSFILFGSDAYKNDWPEIDNINPVKDESVVAQLEKLLDEDLATGQAKASLDAAPARMPESLPASALAHRQTHP